MLTKVKPEKKVAEKLAGMKKKSYLCNVKLKQ